METHVNLTSHKNKTKAIIELKCLLENIILVRLREVELVIEEFFIFIFLYIVVHIVPLYCIGT